MPPLSKHHSAETVKLILMADSGSGKTGALASLANAGYNLRIMDFDNGLDVLPRYCTEEGLARVNYVTLTDALKMSQGSSTGVLPNGVPQALTNAIKLMNHWKTEDEDLGPVTSWGTKDILIVDSITMQGEAAMRWGMAVNGKSQEAKWGHYGPAMEQQEGLFSMLFSTDIKCHVIVTSHIVMQGPEGGERGYPSVLGNKWPPRCGRYFNAILGIKITGSGASQRRSLITVSTHNISYKNPKPQVIPAEIPLKVDAQGHAEGGLADYFKLVLSTD